MLRIGQISTDQMGHTGALGDMSSVVSKWKPRRNHPKFGVAYPLFLFGRDVLSESTREATKKPPIVKAAVYFLRVFCLRAVCFIVIREVPPFGEHVACAQGLAPGAP